MNSLFNIVGEFNELYEMATSEEEQAEQVFIDTLESLKGELTEKAAGYVAVMNRLDMEMKKAEEDMKREIADVSTRLTGKLLEREINDADHRRLIDSFLQEIDHDDDK